MQKTNWTPSIVPSENNHTVYLVADDFKTDRVWREVDYSETDLETVIQDLQTSRGLTKEVELSPPQTLSHLARF